MKQIKAYAYGRGHKIYFDSVDNKWKYVDNDELYDSEKGRPCTHCGKEIDDSGVDPCLGKLPGVKFACCGHGNPKYSYITFENGVVIRGFTKTEG